MPVFNADYAIFGTITAKVQDPNDIGSSVIDYINEFGENLYGDLRGMSVLQAISNVVDNPEEGKRLIRILEEKGAVTSEGKLENRYVKIHTKYIEQGKKSYIQCAIMDMTESKILQKLLYGTSEALKRAAEAADENTGMHISRINQYSGLLARLSGEPQNFIEDISKYAQLHDIGKIRVSDLVKLPRKLTEEEFKVMKLHTVFGAAMVAGLDGLEMAYRIALDHHEKCDGSGYPNGKRANDISLEGKIVAIADVFDALVSKRSYKPACSYADALNIMMKGDGRVMPTHFDSDLLKIFGNYYAEFVELHKKLKD